jgi:WD40 repeat protein
MSSGVKKPHNPHPVRTFSCAAENGVRRGISSLAFDQSRSRLLVNVLNDDIRLFYLRRDQFNGEPVSSPVRTFSGHINSSFYVKGDFSPDSDYVVSGSADGNVYIWPNTSERKMGILHSQLPLLLLKGHSGEVNAVSWRPNDFSTLSSCSDDGTVRIWTINKEMEAPSFQLDGICTLKDSTQGRSACLTWKNQVELTEQTDGFAYPVKVEIDIHVPDTACSPATSPRLLSAIRSPAPQPLSPANQTLTMSVEKTKKKPLTLLDLWGKK